MVSNLGLNLRMVIAGSMLFTLYSMFAAYVFYQFGTSSTVLVAVILGTIIFTLFQYKFGKWSALRSVGAEEMPDKGRYSRIHQDVENLSNDMGIDKPELMVADMGTPNAFAVGRKADGTVVLSTEIISLLNKDELKGVIAHELSHIKNRDVVIMVLGQSIASIIGTAAQFIYLFSGRGRGITKYIVSSVIGSIAQLIVMIFVLAISRYREYIADETAADYTNNPEAMASALSKISNASVNKDKEDLSSASSLFINEVKTNAIQSVLSTHPPIQKRIDRLRSE